MNLEQRVAQPMGLGNYSREEQVTKNVHRASTGEKNVEGLYVNLSRKHKLSTSSESQQRKKRRKISNDDLITAEVMRKAVRKLLKKNLGNTQRRKRSRRHRKSSKKKYPVKTVRQGRNE